jgi:glucans biosynthesis protein
MVVQVRRADKEKPVELRATLRSGTTPLSETWSYVLPPT